MKKIDFEFETEYGTFRDAIVLPENHEYTEKDIEDMKLNRLNNWIALVNNVFNSSNLENIVDGEVISNG